MVTLILTSRVQGNKDSNISNFLNSLISCGGNKTNCEILIKYDTDDDSQPSETFFSNFQLNIKKFVWSRGEGRHSIHLDHFYLFSQRSLQSRFVLLCSDDFTFNRKGFLDDILNINDEFCFVGSNRPKVEHYKNRWREKNVMSVWKHNEGVSLPCFSVKCLEVLQNFGWQCNADNWKSLLTILLYEKYDIDIWRTVPNFYFRNPSDGTSGFGQSFNNMEMDGIKNPQNEYYFTLVEQQAKNLYLNIIDSSKENEKTRHQLHSTI